MITDPTALADAQSAWTAVRNWQKMIGGNIAFSFAMGGITSDIFRTLPYNLVLVFAYGVLEDVLEQIVLEGHFKPKRSGLKALMNASVPVLPWVNHSLVDDGRDKRNKVAHDQIIIPRRECWDFIDAIEIELLAWKVIPTAIPFEH